MKKLICTILCVVMCFSMVTVSAASVPEFMKNIYTNYTADYKISVNIKNADEVVDLLNEAQMPEEVNNYVDIKALIESLCSADTSMNVSLEASEDLRQIKLALTANTTQNIIVNKNFDASYNAKTGIWIDMDIDERELVLIYSTPSYNKYGVIDFKKDAPEEVLNAIFDAYDEMFNREFLEKSNKDIIDMVMNRADISKKGNTYTVKYDNDAFVKMIDDTVDYLDRIFPATEEMPSPYSDVPSFDGIKILGDKGVVCTYKLSGKKIKSFTEEWDISLSLSDINDIITEEPWTYENEGNIDLSIKIEGDVTKTGKTRVTLPQLTEENSFNPTQMYTVDEYEEMPEDWYEPYVSDYSYGWIEEDTFDGERYYMPVRLCIEEAYVGCSEITYDNGVVTIATTSGEEGKDISAIFKVGKDKAVVNGVTYEGFGAFKMIDGCVYASKEFYEECLGWELEYLQKDLLDGSLYYDFCTYSMPEDY